VFAAEADVELRLATSPTKGLRSRGLDLDVVISDQRMPEMSGLAFSPASGRSGREQPHPAHRYRTWRSLSTPSTTGWSIDSCSSLGPDDMRLSIRRALEAKRLADEHES